MTIGFSISILPFSWAVGRKVIRKKTVFALGPFRLSIHRQLPPWGDIQ